MIWIVLAAGLGVANFIIVALLFRRLRNNLNRQLTSMRAERNSEWILSALIEAGAPDERESTAQAVNGNGFEPPPAGQPVRRKRHLGLFLGGGLAALFAAVQEAFSDARKTRRGQLAASAVGLTAAATATALLVAAPWHHSQRTPSSAPTVTITATGQASTPPPVPPPGSPSASTSLLPGATVDASVSPPPGAAGAVGGHMTAISRPTGIPPSSGPAGTPTPSPPGASSTAPAPPAPSSSLAPTTPAPAAGSPCVAIDLEPLLALRLCPLGGG